MSVGSSILGRRARRSFSRATMRRAVFRKEAPELLDTDIETDVERAEDETADLASVIDRAIKQLIANDKSRQRWVEAVDCLRYRDAADFNELHTAIMGHVTSGHWAPEFCKAVLTDLRTITRTATVHQRSPSGGASETREPPFPRLLPRTPTSRLGHDGSRGRLAGGVGIVAASACRDRCARCRR